MNKTTSEPEPLQGINNSFGFRPKQEETRHPREFHNVNISRTSAINSSMDFASRVHGVCVCVFGSTYSTVDREKPHLELTQSRKLRDITVIITLWCVYGSFIAADAETDRKWRRPLEKRSSVYRLTRFFKTRRLPYMTTYSQYVWCYAGCVRACLRVRAWM